MSVDAVSAAPDCVYPYVIPLTRNESIVWPSPWNAIRLSVVEEAARAVNFSPSQSRQVCCCALFIVCLPVAFGFFFLNRFWQKSSWWRSSNTTGEMVVVCSCCSPNTRYPLYGEKARCTWWLSSHNTIPPTHIARTAGTGARLHCESGCSMRDGKLSNPTSSTICQGPKHSYT